MKKNFIIFGLILVIIAELLLIGYTLFIRFRNFTVTFDTDGGSIIESIKVRTKESFVFPEDPIKDGYTFVGWVNEEDKLLLEEPIVESDMTLKARWNKSGSKTVTIKINNNDGSEVLNISVTKGDKILLPESPEREGYHFVGYVNKDNKVLLTNQVVDKNITIKALWISKSNSVNKVTFDTDGGTNVGIIPVETGKKITLPVNPSKTGYIFSGWVDEFGNKVNSKTVINEDLVIRAVWEKGYTCPDGCIPNEDGKTCTKTLTKDMINTNGCPSGYELVKNQCVDNKNRYPAENYQDSNGNWKWKCSNSSDYMYEEIEGLGAVVWCAKKTSKTTTKGCPSGYTKNGDICIKQETVKCTKN